MHDLGPLLQQGLDESLGLTVAPRGVGPGLLGFESHGLAGFSPPMGLVGQAVAAEHPTTLDPLAVEPGHHSAQEAHGGRSLLVGQHLVVGEPRGVLDRHVTLLVAHAGGSPLVWITGDPGGAQHC